VNNNERGFLRDQPADISLLNNILYLEQERGMLAGYRREIIGVGCYDHQDISYTIHFQQIDNPSEIMVIPVTDKNEIFLLRELYGFKDKYVYSRCSRCPSSPDKHNTMVITMVIALSILLVGYFMRSAIIYWTVISSVLLWVCGLLITVYADNCRIDAILLIMLKYWSSVLDNLARWYWFIFWLLTAYYTSNYLLSMVMGVTGLLWMVTVTKILPDEIDNLLQYTTIIHRIIGVRVPYSGEGFPYGE